MERPRYIMVFVLILTTIVAIVLTSLYSLWKEDFIRNEKLFNKRAILASVNPYLKKPVKDMSNNEVGEVFNSQIEQLAVDMKGNPIDEANIVAFGYSDGKPESIDLANENKKPENERIFPVYVYNSDNEKYYILSVRGNGLWDAIWGSVALKSDFNTIAGVDFDHKGETPGMGAEIKDNPNFKNQFIGKKIYDKSGNYKSVYARKGGAKNKDFEVDGISGATKTIDGLNAMLKKGLKYYDPYLQEKRKEK